MFLGQSWEVERRMLGGSGGGVGCRLQLERALVAWEDMGRRWVGVLLASWRIWFFFSGKFDITSWPSSLVLVLVLI